MVRIDDPGAQRRRIERGDTRAERRAAHQVGQVRPEAAGGIRAAHRVTAHARRLLEHLPAGGDGGVVRGRLPLRGDPARELLRRLHDHPQQHVRVLRATELGALTDVESRLPRREPHRVLVIRDDVGLAGEPRHPEAVHDVGRLERHVGRRAHRNVHLVRGGDAQVRILELPPPLVTHHAHAERVGRRDGRLDLVGRPGRGRDEHEHDQDGHDGPCQLDLVAAVHLRRLALVVAGAMAVANDAVDEEPADEEKDAGGDRQHQRRKRQDRVSRSAGGGEDARAVHTKRVLMFARPVQAHLPRSGVVVYVTPSMPAADRRVCVVGAGISGLVTAKVLLEDGFDPLLFEKDATLGGVWSPSRTYPGLCANNSRDTYAFSDHPYPQTAGVFPSSQEVFDYLGGYADRFGLRPRLRLRSQVVRVARPAGASRGFVVTVRPDGAPPTTEHFDYVAVCNGTFSIPRVPRVDGMDGFAGRALHSSELTDPDLIAGRRVVVVGAGKSALDCAAWAATHARTANLVFRRPAWMVPRYLPGGLPGDRLVVSRFAEAFLRYHRQGPAERLLHGPGRALVALFWAGFSRALRRLLRMPATLVPARRLPDGVDEIAVVDDFYDLVRAGRIDARRGAIVRFGGGTTLELTDGARLDADVVVFATGWRQDISFLDEDLRRLVERDGRYHLYRFILPPGLSDLGFVGWNSSTACQLSSEIAAHWLSACFAGELTLPSVDDMEREVAHVHRWAAEVLPRRSQGYFIGPLLGHDMDEMLDDLGIPRKRARTALGEYLLPLWPTRYRSVGEERRSRETNSPARH